MKFYHKTKSLCVLIGLGSILCMTLTSCANQSVPRPVAHTSASYSADAARSKSVSLEEVELAGWLDNPSATFEAPPAPTPQKSEVPVEIRTTQYADLEGLVKSKVGNTVSDIQGKRVLSEEGRLDLVPKWPALAPLQADTLILELGGKLIESRRDFRRFKIPSGQLDSAMKLISPLGEVTFEEIKAEDLSLELGSVKRRLHQLQLLEIKYKELLAIVSEEKKVQVLQYLERVIQDIQVLKQRQELLKERSQWALLNIYFTMNYRQSRRFTPQAIAWIYEVRPWGIYRSGDHEPLELDLVKNFIEVDVDEQSWNPRVWRATNGNGSSVRSWVDHSLPLADAQFWHEALTQQLSNRYEIVKCEIKDTWNWCEFRVDAKDIRWSFIALRGKNQDEDTRLVQLDFPSESIKDQSIQQWQASVKKAMEE